MKTEMFLFLFSGFAGFSAISSGIQTLRGSFNNGLFQFANNVTQNNSTQSTTNTQASVNNRTSPSPSTPSPGYKVNSVTCKSKHIPLDTPAIAMM